MNYRKIIARGASGKRLALAVPQMNLGPVLDCEACGGGLWAVYDGAEIYCVDDLFWIVCLTEAAWRKAAAAYANVLTEAMR